VTPFAPTALPPALGHDGIHVWFFPQWRSDDGRGAESPVVRALLAGYLDVVDVDVEYDERGKAHVRGDALHFNISHSGGALAVAVSRSLPLGIDLEHRRRPRRALELAQRFFAPDEAQALGRLAETERQVAFLRLWTCKEAWVKADGRGIAADLHRAVFDLGDGGDIVGPRERSWHVVPFEPAEGFYGAVAWRGAPQPIIYLLGTMVR
jgi:4'-phosphopantetheinyl transferase